VGGLEFGLLALCIIAREAVDDSVCAKIQTDITC